MNSRQERRLSLLISWAATLIFLWAATYIFELGLGWFAVFPILVALYVNAFTSNAIKRVLVAIFGAPFVNASKYFLFILFGLGSAFYVVHFTQSFPSLTEVVFILFGLALASNGVVRLLAQFGVIHLAITKSSVPK